MISIVAIIFYILMGIGLIGAMFIIAFPFVWLYGKWRDRKLIKKIPDTIKKEVEKQKNEMGKEEDENGEIRERRWDIETERIRRELGGLKPTTASITRLSPQSAQRSNIQELSTNVDAGAKRNTKRNWAEFN